MKPIISLLWGLVVLVICHLTAWADISAPPQNIQLRIGSIPTTKSITQYGITWTFATPVPYGQFVNGDFWVVDPGNGVAITNISPGYINATRKMNGSMINPSHETLQGYDSNRSYSDSLNVGIGISESTPLVLHGNESLVSTISVPGAVDIWNGSSVKTAAVLTCLSTPPPANSFRPGLSGTNKVLHNRSQVNTALLKSLTYPGTKPSISPYALYIQMPYLSHLNSYPVQNIHPVDSGLHNYYYPVTFSLMSLLLHMDYTNEEKENLLINYIQMGIDFYSYIESGANGWRAEGGYGSGKKWPILFAGIMLNYAPMKNVGQISGEYLYSDNHGPGNWPAGYKSFCEDGQTFYVKQADVEVTNGAGWSPDIRGGTPYPYTTAMIGMPEWGIEHDRVPTYDNSAWTAIYRHIGSGGQSWVGFALSARIMNAKSLWNNNAFFDYVDRYVAIDSGSPDPFGFTVQGEAASPLREKQEGLIHVWTIWNYYRKNY